MSVLNGSFKAINNIENPRKDPYSVIKGNVRTSNWERGGGGLQRKDWRRVVRDLSPSSIKRLMMIMMTMAMDILELHAEFLLICIISIISNL